MDVKAGVYTEETLKALNSPAEEITELNKNFRLIESDIVIVKNVNNVSSKQILSSERQMERNVQYSQRECVEISEISASVDYKELDPTVCKVLNHVIVSPNLAIERSSSFLDVSITRK